MAMSSHDARRQPDRKRNILMSACNTATASSTSATVRWAGAVLTEEAPRFQGGLGGDVLRRVKAHVEANLGEHISLNQLAALAGMSRFHFARQFRISTGQSPMGYVRRARIERATAILREREMPIARVAVSLGFADQSHFSRTFGRFIGVSPGSFADRHSMRVRRTSASNMRARGQPDAGY
jgi:AraC family transcriptional regulator